MNSHIFPAILLVLLDAPASHTMGQEVASRTGGTAYVVDGKGSDMNAGTPAAPFRTIMRGVRRARAGDTILVRGGRYNEEIIFDHGGSAGRPIILRNAPGESAVIDGSMDVGGWVRVDGTNVWRAGFRHARGIPTPGDFEDAVSVSTCPDRYAYSGDRRAFLYVDDTPDRAHWLRPVSIVGDSPEYSIAGIPAGAFATDVPPPPLPRGQFYSGTGGTVYVHLADHGDPNNHRIRIPAFGKGIKFRSSPGDRVSYVEISGFAIQLAEVGIGIATHFPNVNSHITLESLDISLNNERGIQADFCSRHIVIRNCHVHHMQEEGIHLESDSSTVEHTLVERTIAPWARYGSMGINVLGSNDTISGNEIRFIATAVNGHGGDGVYMEEWYNGNGDIGCHDETGQNTLVRRNSIHDNQHRGISVPGDDSTAIINNLIYRNGDDGIRVSAGGSTGRPTAIQQSALDVHIYHNTIYGNGRHGIALGSPEVQRCRVRNNIVFGNGAGILNRGTASSIDHNVSGDPLFVDPARGDFRILARSPAVNAGVDVGVFDDYDAGVRSPENGWDAGALQSARPGPGSLHEVSVLRLWEIRTDRITLSATVKFSVPESMNVDLRVFDFRGRQAGILISGNVSAGMHVARWDASRQASGIYFCRLAGGASAQVRKFVLFKGMQIHRW